MRFLGVGEYNSLGDMYWRLSQAGHEVRVHIGDEESQDIFAGMIQCVENWRHQLDWIREAGDDGIIIFESATQGEVQDTLRQKGFHVVGGSAYGDRLENERGFGQAELRALGLKTAAVHEFADFDSGLLFLHENPGRYVFKHNGSDSASSCNYVGEMDDGADVSAFIQMERRRRDGAACSFVLMEYLCGVEVGVGAYFNGQKFLSPVLLDWEHKRFFPGDLGELTGEMGTLVTYRSGERLFDATLAKMADRLAAHGHCGYINLNTIINQHGVWPLELTCRFGYPGFAICDALHEKGWDHLFRTMVTRRETSFPTRDGYAVGVVLTVPPFPYPYGYVELSKAAPIFFRQDMTSDERLRLHFAEVALEGQQPVTAGSVGYVMVATGCGADATTAQYAAYQLAKKVVVPNLRYRNDIGQRFIDRDRALLCQWGWL